MATPWDREKRANLRPLDDSRFLDVLTRPLFDRAIVRIKGGKAAGHDGLPKEAWIWVDEAMDDLFTQTSLAWNLETFHEYLVLALIAILFKGKGKNPNVYNSTKQFSIGIHPLLSCEHYLLSSDPNKWDSHTSPQHYGSSTR